MEAITAKPVYCPMGVSKNSMAETKGYTVATLTMEDTEGVLNFLKKFFFKDEPLNLCIGLLDEERPRCIELEKFCVEPIAAGLSLKAVSPSGEIIGVCLNGVIDRHQEEPDMECNNPKFQKIKNLLERIYVESDILGMFPEVDKFLDIKVASVDVAYRGQGIAKALFDETRKIAQERGFQIVKVDCSSHFTALAVAKLGFQLIYTLNYEDHKDENGKPIFTPEPPHTCAKTFVYRLN